MESWGLLRPEDKSDHIDGFLKIACDRIEQSVGSFDSVADQCELVFRPNGITDEVELPCFELRVPQPLCVHVKPLIDQLTQRGGEEVAAWVGLNLCGPHLFGPTNFTDIVSMTCWMGEPDEEEIIRERKACGDGDTSDVFKKADLLQETAAWVDKPLRPACGGATLQAVQELDPVFAAKLQAFIDTRTDYERDIIHRERDDSVAMDTTIFLWDQGNRIGDLYDEYINNEFNGGMSIEWAWTLPVDDYKAAERKLRCCRTYLNAAAELARYIQSNYPA